MTSSMAESCYLYMVEFMMKRFEKKKCVVGFQQEGGHLWLFQGVSNPPEHGQAWPWHGCIQAALAGCAGLQFLDAIPTL